MLPEAGDLEKEFQCIVDILAGVVREYLSEARGSLTDDFGDDTPFMDAGLDSLDLLKVSRKPQVKWTNSKWIAHHFDIITL